MAVGVAFVAVSDSESWSSLGPAHICGRIPPNPHYYSFINVILILDSVQDVIPNVLTRFSLLSVFMLLVTYPFGTCKCATFAVSSVPGQSAARGLDKSSNSQTDRVQKSRCPQIGGAE